MSSRRSLILAGIKSALERINGTGDYHNSIPAAKIQRVGFAFDGDELEGPSLEDATIVIGQPSDARYQGGESCGARTWVLSVPIEYRPRASLTADQVEEIVEDVKRALAAGEETGFGGSAREADYPNVLSEPEANAPLGSIRFDFSCVYTEAFGNPASPGD